MKQAITVLKILLVVVLVAGYFVFVRYDELRRQRRSKPLQREVVMRTWTSMQQSSHQPFNFF